MPNLTQAKDAPAPPASRGRAKHVLVGRWAGDRVLADEYCGYAKDYLPADLIARYPDSDPDVGVLEFALTNFKHVGLPGYKHKGADDGRHAFPRRSRLGRAQFDEEVLRARGCARQGEVSARTGRLGRPGARDRIWAEIGGAMSARVKGGRGDRFDIQPLAAVEDSEDGTEWADLSKEAKRCVRTFEQDYDIDQY
ncbi:hypothetical protein B0H17DRAFT_1142012 [Mycena rosella]|uniref:Uncharacterized protein n=1 Tax=Mycena rosella TaxID=1033263 RepID=A0AAD7G9Y0_MYCRO|nr:hypothetical protein B0H17DRAFT_1142012 [Mycena rosella]